MSHTYANVSDFKKYILSGSDPAWTGDDAQLLTFLESASRRVDAWCDRSQYGSGFGPRIGTNTYDTCAWGWEVPLDDDALTMGTVTVDGGTVTDYRSLPRGSVTRFIEFLSGSSGTAVTVTGTFGYWNETLAAGTAFTAGSASTSIVIGGGTVYAGDTLSISSEQLYVTAQSGGTATVVRGQNGTTGGTVVSGTAVYVYRYPREVMVATMQLAQRRYRSAQAGLTGDFGGGALPGIGHRDSERSILMSLQHLRLYGAA